MQIAQGAPTAFDDEPAGHLAQPEPFTTCDWPENPGAQTLQEATLVAPEAFSVVQLPPGQGTQDAPSVAMYVPAAQVVQGMPPDSGLIEPAGHGEQVKE